MTYEYVAGFSIDEPRRDETRRDDLDKTFEIPRKVKEAAGSTTPVGPTYLGTYLKQNK